MHNKHTLLVLLAYNQMISSTSNKNSTTCIQLNSFMHNKQTLIVLLAYNQIISSSANKK